MIDDDNACDSHDAYYDNYDVDDDDDDSDDDDDGDDDRMIE